MPALRPSLSTKLAAIAALLICSLFAKISASWHVLSRIELATTELSLLREAQRRTQNADMLHDAVRAAVLRALLDEEAGRDREPEALLRALGHDCDELRAEIRALEAMPLPPELAASVAETGKITREYAKEAEHIGWLAVADRRAAFEEMPAFDGAFETTKEALARETDELGRRSLLAAEAAERRGHEVKHWLLVAGLLTSSVSIGLMLLVLRSVRRSLAKVRDVARAVAGGDLDQRAAVSSQDEVGQLAVSVNQMADNLKKTIEHVRTEVARGTFSAELVEAFEIADSEAQAHAVVARAMPLVSPDHPMELLVADSSNAHLERAATHPAAGAPGCGVESPFGCVAVRRGATVVFDDSEALKACPHLRGRACGSVSAVCVPVTFMGRALGVLHAAGPVGAPLSEAQCARLRTLGSQAGGRIGTVRAFERTQIQATTDALTSLPNRRAVERIVHDMAASDSRFALLLCDLDHFKRLNDQLGHPAGDAALRLFSDVLRGSLGANDHAARWGGEEFCIVLAGADAEAGVDWADRVRDRLARTIAKRSSPAFTASFGVVDSSQSRQLEALIRAADEALYRAKHEGRDRAVTASAISSPGGSARQETERRAAINLRMVGDAA